LSLRKKLGGKQEERVTCSDKKVFVRPVQEIIHEVFRTELLAEMIVKEPKPLDMPTEVYESKNFAELVPKLSQFINGKKYTKGKRHFCFSYSNI
jgi:hypothetical protein